MKLGDAMPKYRNSVSCINFEQKDRVEVRGSSIVLNAIYDHAQARSATGFSQFSAQL